MQQANLAHYIRIASHAARRAGLLIAKRAGRPHAVRRKRSISDLVTEIDRESEHIIRRILRRAFPQHGFLGEEEGARKQNSSYRWIVDPLDGTTNFVHGLPFFSISIALEHERELIASVIYDPMRKELFSATRRGGAFLNGRRLSVSRAHLLSDSILATGFSLRSRRQPKQYLHWFKVLESRSHAVRRIGSTALCLAYVAAGQLDGFYEQDLSSWDIAAGLLLIQESGGSVTNFSAHPVRLEEGELVASNGHIHRQLLRVLKRSAHP